MEKSIASVQQLDAKFAGNNVGMFNIVSNWRPIKLVKGKCSHFGEDTHGVYAIIDSSKFYIINPVIKDDRAVGLQNPSRKRERFICLLEEA